MDWFIDAFTWFQHSLDVLTLYGIMVSVVGLIVVGLLSLRG